MSFSIWRLLVLVLPALGLGPGAAHVLELPAKMAYSPVLYAAVTSSLYALFGTVGAAIQIGAVLAAGIFAWRTRHRPEFRLALFGALALAISLVIWGAIVAPVNSEWSRVIQDASEPVADAYARLRQRWEYGHVAAFAAWLVGYCLLVFSVLRETERSMPLTSRDYAQAKRST